MTAFEALRAELPAGELDLMDIHRVGAGLLAAEVQGGMEDGAGAAPYRVAVLSSLTGDFIARAVACGLAQEGVRAAVHQPALGTWRQEILDAGSGLHRFRPDLVVIAPDWRDEVEELPPGTPAEAVAVLTGRRAEAMAALWARLPAGARVVQHTLVPPPWGLRGVADRRDAGAVANQVEALNAALLARGTDVQWVELDRLAAQVGTRNWWDEGAFHAARLPFALKFLGEYALAFRAAWRAAAARPRKVLVLDLDNTLWGGVIGDDGVDGIRLGPGSPAGEAFLAWNRHVAALRARGVILAVCSKNDPAIAAAAFEHPHMPLRLADFAAFDCAWTDKAAGLRRIAAAVNVGLDSLVFADDNPAECDQVARALPEVGVVHLGTDPARFIALLDRGHWFDAASYTAEDLGRAAAYAARAEAEAVRAASDDVGAFLDGLRMRGTVTEARPADVERLAQMENKTNQFNVTTRRHGAAAISAFMARPDCHVLCLRLADRFGDHGLVASLVAVREGDTMRIDSWLMSCRVFARTAEHFVLNHLVAVARGEGCRRIRGEYAATARNGVVADLFGRLGFGDAGQGGWTLELDGGGALPTAIVSAAEAPALAGAAE